MSTIKGHKQQELFPWDFFIGGLLICLLLTCARLAVNEVENPVLPFFGTKTKVTNNKQVSIHQQLVQATPNYTTSTHQQKIIYTYQEYKTKHKSDKSLLELFDLYYAYFVPNWRYEMHCTTYTGTEEETCYRDLDIFCSQRLWGYYGIYTNINPEDKDCFCKYNRCYKDDKCILIRRKAMDKDIGFFDYKFFLPDDLQISKDKFKQLASKYRTVKALQQIKCRDNKLELTSTEREACARHMEDYMTNLSYNKIPICNKRYITNKCSDEQIYRVRKVRSSFINFEFGLQNVEICEQLQKIQFEIDNNCVLKE